MSLVMAKDIPGVPSTSEEGKGWTVHPKWAKTLHPKALSAVRLSPSWAARTISLSCPDFFLVFPAVFAFSHCWVQSEEAQMDGQAPDTQIMSQFDCHCSGV